MWKGRTTASALTDEVRTPTSFAEAAAVFRSAVGISYLTFLRCSEKTWNLQKTLWFPSSLVVPELTGEEALPVPACCSHQAGHPFIPHRTFPKVPLQNGTITAGHEH